MRARVRPAGASAGPPGLNTPSGGVVASFRSGSGRIGFMDRLWAPWRAQYIRDASESAGADPGCFLCRAIAGDDDRENLLAWRRPRSIVVLNRYPYNNGHL